MNLLENAFPYRAEREGSQACLILAGSEIAGSIRVELLASDRSIIRSFPKQIHHTRDPLLISLL
jgi:hypothetical protein